MAKKKKKMIKLNQSIRHFFGDEGFDEGIERVPTEALIALAHTLGIFNGTTDKTGLIKTFRRLWSEGESDNREMIVAFFKQEGKIYPNPKPKEKPHEREEKIDELLEAFELSDAERRDLHASFIDIRTRKITPDKIASKLEHIRYTRKRESLEKAVEGKFNFDDSLEYYAPITYRLDGESFTKIHVLKTAPLNEKRLHEEALEILVPEITELKNGLTQQKQAQTDLFLSSLNLTAHRYLSREQIIASLKSAPPSTQTYGSLNIDILRDVLARHLHTPLTSITSDDLIIEIDKQLPLPHRTEPLEYTLSLHLDANELSRQIWNEEELTITTMVEEQSIHEERAFLNELEHLMNECRERSKLLEMNEESLYAIVYELLLPYLTLTPHISSKTSRRVLFSYDQRIAGELLKRQRQALLARTVRDFKNLFPLARSLRRRLIFHTGPTNSGKTYTAFQQLKKAGTGYYLAPLRLLALEGYETLRMGVSARRSSPEKNSSWMKMRPISAPPSNVELRG